MKLIDHTITANDGAKLRWHAITDVFVDTVDRRMLVTYGSWVLKEDAMQGARPSKKATFEAFFPQWSEGIIEMAPDFLVSAGELLGGSVVDVTEPMEMPQEPVVLERFIEPIPGVFDVGVMP